LAFRYGPFTDGIRRKIARKYAKSPVSKSKAKQDPVIFLGILYYSYGSYQGVKEYKALPVRSPVRPLYRTGRKKRLATVNLPLLP
jgi:hypothetical protein